MDELGGGGEIIEGTFDELKALQVSEQLKQGTFYRITDYADTSDYTFAGNQFDIIVLATSANTFSSNARAIQHDGDYYFNGQNLEKWILQIDMNTQYKFSLITFMKDDKGNSAYYDFKNFKFSKNIEGEDVYCYTFCDSNDLSDLSLNQYFSGNSIGRGGLGGNVVYASSNSSASIKVNIGDNSTGNLIVGGNRPLVVKIGSSSMGNTISRYVYSEDAYQYASDVEIGSFSNSNTITGSSKVKIGDRCNSNSVTLSNFVRFGNDCNQNTVNSSSYMIIHITLGDYCNTNTISGSYNTFGVNCNSNNLGSSCYNNQIGDNCNGNTLQGGASFNVIYPNIYGLQVGGGSTRNVIKSPCTIGQWCHGNFIDSGTSAGVIVLNDGCSINKIGQSCTGSILLKSGCQKNIIGSNCENIEIQGGGLNNIIGNDCENILIKRDNESTYIPEGNVIGNGCSSITLLENGCSFNKFGDGCSTITLPAGSQYNEFKELCHDIVITTGGGLMYNSFGYGCYSITLRNGGSSNNRFGNACHDINFQGSYNTIGDNCYNIESSTTAIPPTINRNSLGVGCSDIIFNGDDNHFGNGVKYWEVYQKECVWYDNTIFEGSDASSKKYVYDQDKTTYCKSGSVVYKWHPSTLTPSPLS